MSDGIEIYVRNSGDKTLLTFHIPEEKREEFFRQFSSGSEVSVGVPIHLEFSVMPEWISDLDQQAIFTKTGNHLHCRLPISSLCIH